MEEASHKKTEPEGKLKPAREKFKSSFKAWIRVVAFIVLVVFLPEQVVLPIEYNPAIFWKHPVPPNTQYSLLNTKIDPAVFNKAVARSVYRFLKPLINKPASQIQLKPGLTIETSNLQLTTSHLKLLYEWLKKPETETAPCSVYVLYNLLKEKGIQVRVEELSTLLILIDTLVGNIDAKLTSNSYFYNSLYALQKTAEYFGLKLYPVKIDSNALMQHAQGITPFIAHLFSETTTPKAQPTTQKGHFVLVTKIT
ncbi:MAG: hypothetical protein NC912_03815, partial [Candidatus Omnitrophica bacterium]|nr:hypothetical protein [Candidatus Omnitrophota bacterium]